MPIFRRKVTATEITLLCDTCVLEMEATLSITRSMPSKTKYLCPNGCEIWTSAHYPRLEWDKHSEPVAGPVPKTMYLKVRNLLYDTAYRDCVNIDSDGGLWFRCDIEECAPKEQWTEYCELSDDLRKLGLRLDDPTIEHDCISGLLHLIPKEG